MRLSSALRLSTVVCFVLFLAGAIFGGFVTFDPEIFFGPPLIVMAFSVAALLCAATLERGRLVGLMWSGIGASAASAVGWSALVIMQGAIEYRTAEAWAYSVLAPTSWAAICALTGLLMRERMPLRVGVWVRGLTLACGSALAVAIPIALVVTQEATRDDLREVLTKLIGCLAVVTGFGTIFTLIAARIRQLEGASEEDCHVQVGFTVTCPRCDDRQPMVTGGGTCRRCGLRIKVVVP